MPSRFCIECKNFEDRVEIDGVALCAKGHTPGVSCPEFQDRLKDILLLYLLELSL